MRGPKLVVPVPVGASVQKKRGRPPLPIVTHPASLWEVHEDPQDFHAALDLQIRLHGENANRLHRAVVAAGGLTDRTTLAVWRRGLKIPQTPASLKVLDIIEHRYRSRFSMADFADLAANRFVGGSLSQCPLAGSCRRRRLETFNATEVG